MLGPVYTSLSGLLTFSRGLDVLSNNVTNLNTPGYKGSELQFREQFYRYRMTGENNGRLFASQIGSGVVGQDTSLRFGQGDLQETGEGTDIAIDGNGFFVLREGGNELFTRAGQFAFDDDGYLVARGSDARVLGMDASGSLVDISLSGLRSRPPKATSRVSFVNNLSTGATGHEVSGVEVFDRLGKKHELTVVFTNNSGTHAPKAAESGWPSGRNGRTWSIPTAIGAVNSIPGDSNPSTSWQRVKRSTRPPSSACARKILRSSGFRPR